MVKKLIFLTALAVLVYPAQDNKKRKREEDNTETSLKKQRTDTQEDVSPKQYTTLHDAILASDTQALSVMLEQKKWDINEIKECSINTQKYTLTPLMLAADVGQFDIVKLLVNSGADINKENTQGITA